MRRVSPSASYGGAAGSGWWALLVVVVTWALYYTHSGMQELSARRVLVSMLEERAEALKDLEDELHEQREVVKRIAAALAECSSHNSSSPKTLSVSAVDASARLPTASQDASAMYLGDGITSSSTKSSLGSGTYTVGNTGVQFSSPKSLLGQLYAEFGAELAEVREEMHTWARRVDLHAGIGDVEAEVLYLRVRRLKPEAVAELGFGQGLCTMWLLHALRRNGRGTLTTFDVVDEHSRRKDMDSELTSVWQLVLGDARGTLPRAGSFQYVHSDAEHSVAFVGWLTRSYLEQQVEGLHVSFHDVFISGSRMAKDSSGITPEGRVLLQWIASRQQKKQAVDDMKVFSLARSHFREEYQSVAHTRQSVGLDENWVATKASTLNNPSVFFLT
mmetsp:Transcript_44325/g.84752  ORF Transcript_44325/g.84752 Transcript_44325/m.84752 type:complete len:388 (+) Transcript_44325:269-1432(+)